MKFSIMIPEEVEIDDSLIPELYEKIRKRFRYEADTEVFVFDLIKQAVRGGHLRKLPRGWEMVWEDEYATITKKHCEAIKKRIERQKRKK